MVPKDISQEVPRGRSDTDQDPIETRDWIESIESIVKSKGPERARYLMSVMGNKLRQAGVDLPYPFNTPYVNTIPVDEEPEYPGDREIERQIKSYVRWNAMAMVVKANRVHSGIGGHISTFASAATLYEVGFNHFFRGKTEDYPGDQVYFQGHASPGIYARAFVEGRLSQKHLNNFRQELAEGGGLSSYPHPYLMPDFWQFPSVSMGLVPLMSIYQARFNRYLRARGFMKGPDPKVWAYLGDGEIDEPESLGAITLASRENLDNLIWIVNCNLQRLDGPVRGNGKIIQELEATFRGAGWNVIKVVWGSDWDELLKKDTKGLLVQRMNEVCDGEYQKYTVEPGSYTRKQFFGKYPELLAMVNHLSDEQIRKLTRGGHDPRKVFAAYKRAVEHRGQPTVILAKTIKGYGLGEAGEGRNITHQQKKLNEKELREFKKRFHIPISDEEVVEMPFYRPDKESQEFKYLIERRKALGGFLPRREYPDVKLTAPDLKTEFAEVIKGSGDSEASTTMAFVRLLTKLLRNPKIGRHIVPIIPDEARTFGMEGLFRQFGIYSSKGQLYEPVDMESLMPYIEKKDGQVLEEGINEAGAMSSLIAAGTSYATHGTPMIPFFIYYSMFGFQRIGDLIWAAADCRTKGFLLGATAGRTTLNGEGLQHEDGHSHLLASTVPTIYAYDPAFSYEIAVIVRDGLKRMYEDNEEVMYYLTLHNENYTMPSMPEGVEEGIIRGLYKFRASAKKKPAAHILGSGSILREGLRAQEILSERYGVEADVWSVTSYKLLRNDAIKTERWNRLHPNETPRKSYVETQFAKEKGVFVAVSDYMKIVSDQIGPWVPGGLVSLGTDGFGRSDSRPALRRFFEVDAECVVIAVLDELSKRKEIDRALVQKAIKDLGVDPEKSFPAIVS